MWPVLTLLLLSTACGLPKDPESTLERVSGGTLRIGVTESDPWVVLGSGEPTGVEVEIVKRFAEELDAEIEWVEGTVDELAAAVHVREVDLMIGGLAATSKISSEASLSHPYLTTQVVVGVPPGSGIEDIAGIEIAVEDGTEAAGILEKTDAIPVRVEDVMESSGPAAVESYLLDELGLEDTGVRLIETDHVMAVPHGENAWIVRLERFLLEHESDIEDLLDRVS